MIVQIFGITASLPTIILTIMFGVYGLGFITGLIYHIYKQEATK